MTLPELLANLPALIIHYLEFGALCIVVCALVILFVWKLMEAI